MTKIFNIELSEDEVEEIIDLGLEEFLDEE